MPRPSRSTSFGFSGQTSYLRALLRGWTDQPRLLTAVDLLIAFLLVIYPFVMGGRESWGHWLLITCACLLSGLWCLHRFFEAGRLRWLGLEPLLFAGLLLVWFQTQPLPDALLRRVSGEYERLIPAWGLLQQAAKPDVEAGNSGATDTAGATDAEGTTGAWTTISFLPVETRHALLVLTAYGLIAAVFVQRLSSEADCRWILKLTAVSGVLMAIFAVLQLLLSNDRFFWFYQHPWTGTREVLKGAFTNRNHFAQFLVLSLGPLIWWALAGGEPGANVTVMNRRGLGPAQGNHSQIDTLLDPRQLLLLAGTAGVLISVLLSLSRGGFLAAGTACCVVFAGLWRSGRVGSSMAVSIIVLGSLAIAGMAVFGGQKVENRVAQLATLDSDKLDESNARRSIWRADFRALQRFPLLGTGVGSHRYVYPVFMEDLADYTSCTFSHAESSWVHLALETGWTGVTLLALGLGVIVLRIGLAFLRRTDSGRIAALAAAAAALAGGLVHSVADFIWYVPAIVVTTLALIIAALRLCSADGSDSGIPLPRPAWMGMAAGCLVLAISVQPALQQRITGEHWWYRYLVSAFESRRAIAERGLETDEAIPVGDSDEGVEAAASMVAESADNSEDELTQTEGVAAYGRRTAVQPADPRERIQELRAQLAMLLKSWKVRPAHPDVAVHIARRSLELFELMQSESDNPLPLVQIRDAVLGSDFTSQQAMLEFLNRAFGNNIRLPLLADTMSRNALLLCPLQTEAWKNLISTGFLRDPRDAEHLRMMAQTLRLGRFDPTIRFSVGQSLFLSGRPEEAVVQWNAAFHANRDIRKRICVALAPRFPADAVLQNFKPGLMELEDVFQAYRQQQSPNDMRRLVEAIAEQSRKIPEASLDAMTTDAEASDGGSWEPAGDEAAGAGGDVALNSAGDEELQEPRLVQLLMGAASTAGELKIPGIQETLLRRAATVAPESEWPRRALGMLLFERQDYPSAERLFAACAELSPGDTQLEDLRRECRRLQQQKQRRLRTVSGAASGK
ncbi:MAG: hypothetical protein RLZZ436_3780 [Planctomycetota bacterium]